MKQSVYELMGFILFTCFLRNSGISKCSFFRMSAPLLIAAKKSRVFKSCPTWDSVLNLKTNEMKLHFHRSITVGVLVCLIENRLFLMKKKDSGKHGTRNCCNNSPSFYTFNLFMLFMHGISNSLRSIFL